MLSHSTFSCAVLVILLLLGLVSADDRQRDGVTQHSIQGASAILDHSLLNVQWPRGNRRARRYHPKCDIAAKSGICLNDGRSMIIPDASANGTIGTYAFDEVIPGVMFDASGNGNHGIAGPRSASLISMDESLAGPSSAASNKLSKAAGKEDSIAENNPLFAPTVPTVAGRNGGLASSFNGRLYYRIAPSASLDALREQFTASFWLYLADPSVTSKASTGCPIFTLGESTVSLTSERNLALTLPKFGSTTSHARIRSGHWTHVTFTYDKKTSEYAFFVNGVPDVTVARPLALSAGGSVFIGSSPASQCQHAAFYIDDLQLSALSASPATIAAQAFSALGSTESAYVHLACSRDQSCSFEQARAKCMSGYHLCSQRELAAGGYAMGRTQGWLHYADKLWTSDDALLFKHTFKLKPRVDVHSEQLADDELLSNAAHDDGHKGTLTGEWDIEEEVLGEHSAKYLRQRALKQALAAEREAMSEPKLAMCCAYEYA